MPPSSKFGRAVDLDEINGRLGAAPQLDSIAEAAEFLERHPNTVRNWVRSGRLKSYKLGPKLIFVRHADVTAMLQPVAKGGQDAVR